MAESLPETLVAIITALQSVLQNVVILRRETDAKRAIPHVRGDYNDYQIYLREIIRADGSRKYAYYVIRDGHIIAGFDNAPDPMALRLKYGSAYTEHRQEAIPHLHRDNKQTVELTAEIDYQTFLSWLAQNL